MAKAAKLTDIAIRNYKPGEKRQEISDGAARGLYLIVQPSGFKGFATRYEINGKSVKISHGEYGKVSLSAARKLNADVLHEVKQGNNPRIAKQKAKAKRKAIEADTFAALVERYFQIECGLRRGGDTLTFSPNHRTAARRLADLERLVLPVLGKRPVSEIRRSEVVAVLDTIELEQGPVMADRTLGYVRRIFNWHAARSDDFRSPVVRGMTRTKSGERARQRILTDDEIRKVWVDAPGPFPALIKFLLLVCPRRDEAARMTWDEVKDGVWELPAARNKTKLPLARPLSSAALAVIESQRRDDGSRYVFTNDGKTPFQDFTRSKKEFDVATGVSDYVLHDLRRSSRSLLSRAQVSERVAELCLGHVIGGVKGVYDRHSYFHEKQDAYDKLAALIERIANPPEGNVTPLRKNKRA
jgi:integrase